MAAPSFVNAVATALSSSFTGTYTVTLPTYAADDIVFVLIASQNLFGSTDTLAAAGWTLLDSGLIGASGVGATYFVFSRVMDGTEGSTVTFTYGGSNSGSNKSFGFASSYRHPDGAPVIDGSVVTGFSITSGSTVFTSLDVETSGADELVLCFIGYTTGSSTPGFNPAAGETERYDAVSALISGTRVGGASNDQVAATAGSHSAAGAFNTALRYRAVALALAPPAAPPPTTSIKTILGASYPSNVKTVEGLVQASVETVEGLA